MTIDDFKKTRFGPGMKIKYSGEIYNVISTDFKEYLFGFIICGGDLSNISWARCENCELLEKTIN